MLDTHLLWLLKLLLLLLPSNRYLLNNKNIINRNNKHNLYNLYKLNNNPQLRRPQDHLRKLHLLPQWLTYRLPLGQYYLHHPWDLEFKNDY